MINRKFPSKNRKIPLINRKFPLVSIIKSVYLCNVNIKHLEPRYEVKWCVPSYQKSIDVLGYTEKTDLKEGLTKMWEWAKTQPKREQFKWEIYEIDKGIYTYWK
mgnify:CR=1 FL=1